VDWWRWMKKEPSWVYIGSSCWIQAFGCGRSYVPLLASSDEGATKIWHRLCSLKELMPFQVDHPLLCLLPISTCGQITRIGSTLLTTYVHGCMHASPTNTCIYGTQSHSAYKGIRWSFAGWQLSLILNYILVIEIDATQSHSAYKGIRWSFAGFKAT